MKHIKTHVISMAAIALTGIAFVGSSAFAQNESKPDAASDKGGSLETKKAAENTAPTTPVTTQGNQNEAGVVKGLSTHVANPFANDPDVAAINAAQQAAPQPSAPQKPLTKEEIAQQIAPDFDVDKNYNRFVQCYGTLDFMSAFMEVRAKQAGANKGIKSISSQLTNLKKGLQPFVLATSTLKTEAQFRKDYNAVAEKTSERFFNAKNPEAELQNNLKTINSCQQEARKWAGIKPVEAKSPKSNKTEAKQLETKPSSKAKAEKPVNVTSPTAVKTPETSPEISQEISPETNQSTEANKPTEATETVKSPENPKTDGDKK